MIEIWIGDDGKNHYVVVRVNTASGATYYQFAEATDEQKRKPITEFSIKFIIFTLIGICAHKTLVKKSSIKKTRKEFRLHRNSQNRRNKSLSFYFNLFFAEFLALLFIPWGIFPIFQGSTGVVYTFICLYSNDGIHALFLFETFMYSCLRIVLVLPFIYQGIKKNKLNMIRIGAIFLIFNAIFLLIWSIHHFGIAGFNVPGVYFDFIIGITILSFSHKKFS